MSKYGAFTRMEDLRDWFFRNAENYGSSEWVLYHGHAIKTAGSSSNKSGEQRSEEVSADDSWDQLESLIMAQSATGGKFTVYMPIGGSSTRRGVRAMVDLPDRYGPRGAGVGGFGDIEQAKADAVEMAMLRRDIEDMRSAQMAEQSPLNRILEELINSGAVTQIVGMLGAKMAGVNPPANQPLPPMGSSGADNMAPPDVAGIENNLGRIAKHFPDLDAFIESLADFVESQPETAQQIFNGMRQKRGNE